MTQNLSVGATFNEDPSRLQFVPVIPCRLLDLRNDWALWGSYTFDLRLLAQTHGCADLSSAGAYSLNVTLIPLYGDSVSYFTIWPTGQTQPLVSLMNSPDGRIKANAAIVPAGSNGEVNVFSTDPTYLVLDIDGYFAVPGQSTLTFYPLTPCRVVDTREGSNMPQGLGPPFLQNMEQRELPILTSPCLQGVSPQAYSFNVTVVPNPAAQPLNYVTVWPSDKQQPNVSTLNNPTGTVVANAAIVPASASNGDIDVFAYNSTDLIIDITGYFAASGQKGLSLYPLAPCRAYDSRDNQGQPFNGRRAVDIAGSPCAPPSTAQAYVFNATVVPTSGPMGYLTLWPDGENMPVVSTLNAYDGFITSNMAIVPNTNGWIDAYADGLTQLILDISGYFAP